MEAEALRDEFATELEIQHALADPVAFIAKNDPDTMYHHTAMQQPDKKQFMEAMAKEINDHESRGHWDIILRKDVPKGTKVLKAVWSMKRKRRIDTREVYKWKARLNIHGGQQEYGVNYWETYAPVAQWSSIRLFMTIAIMKNWHMKQADFTLAYLNAEADGDLFMEIPVGFHVDGDRKRHVLKLRRNLYGSKQAGRVWNIYLDKYLKENGWTPSIIDPCVYYKGTCIMLLFTDDTLLIGPDEAEIEHHLEELGDQFDLTNQGTVDEYLGLKITRSPDGKVTIAQPQLIDSILEDLSFQKGTKGLSTPAIASQRLERDQAGEDFNGDFHFRSVIGKLNYLEKSTRPDLSFAVHQVARFTHEPKQSHAKAIRRICRYLVRTRDKGIILDPKEESFTCYADADFGGLFNKDTAADDRTTAKSRTGFIIAFSGCPIIWTSRLQTETALSSTEAEYIALSSAARELIPLMHLITEAREHGVPISYSTPTVHCRLFEDNIGAIELAKVPKMRPRTKHINVKYHHFREFVTNGKIRLLHIETENQPADLLTKALGDSAFMHLRKKIMGW